MSLSELIARYGDERVVFQRLDDCITSLSMSKHGSKASFVTPERINLDGFERLGLIVWMDRDRVAAIIAESKSNPTQPPEGQPDAHPHREQATDNEVAP